jgi:hypothetical protein
MVGDRAYDPDFWQTEYARPSLDADSRKETGQLRLDRKLCRASWNYQVGLGSSRPLINACPFFFCPPILEKAMLVVDILCQEAEASSDNDIQG